VKDKWGGMYSQDEPPAVRDWCVLVEENLGRERIWSVSAKTPVDDREEAVALAARLAREHEPQHPSFARHREIYRIGEDIWLVDVEGATRAYHFRISVARVA
jgi:hypothetical protein